MHLDRLRNPVSADPSAEEYRVYFIVRKWKVHHQFLLYTPVKKRFLTQRNDASKYSRHFHEMSSKYARFQSTEKMLRIQILAK
jgi:hypothetical protein